MVCYAGHACGAGQQHRAVAPAERGWQGGVLECRDSLQRAYPGRHHGGRQRCMAQPPILAVSGPISGHSICRSAPTC